MKNLIFIIFLFAFSETLYAVQPQGKWKVHNDISGNASNQDCSFLISGNSLSGQCSSEKEVIPIFGTVNNNQITWEYQVRRNLIKLTVIHSGTLANGSIRGNVLIKPFNANGTFTAQATQ